MLDNAKWRDEQRRENIKKYKEDADKEKTVSTKHKHGAEFLKYMLRFNSYSVLYLLCTLLN